MSGCPDDAMILTFVRNSAGSASFPLVPLMISFKTYLRSDSSCVGREAFDEEAEVDAGAREDR